MKKEGFSLAWVRGIKDEREKEELYAQYKAAAPVLKRLTEILTAKLKESEAHQKKTTNFVLPHWPAFQADCNGYQRALEEVIHHYLSDRTMEK